MISLLQNIIEIVSCGGSTTNRKREAFLEDETVLKLNCGPFERTVYTVVKRPELSVQQNLEHI